MAMTPKINAKMVRSTERFFGVDGVGAVVGIDVVASVMAWPFRWV
jgi:hypothetical protein